MSLREAYAACRRVNARTGRTFYLATLLLPAWKRPYVHALYAFARRADEIVDGPDARSRAERLAAWGGSRGGDTAVGLAFRDTVARWGVDDADVEAFLASMAMDLTVTSYDTWDDLAPYVHGSAAVIGRWTVPILEPLDATAYAYAADLGVAFQLANVVRDVGEDLRRGRVYLPREDLDHFGVTREDLASGVVDGRVRRLLAYEVARTRELLRAAEPGVRLLHPTSRDCVRTAMTLYGGILDAVERADYQVLDRRVSVGIGRRVAVAGGGLVRAGFSRRGAARTHA